MQKDDATLLRAFYFLCALIVTFVFWKAGSFIGVRTGLLEQHGSTFTIVTVLISLAISFGFVWWLGHNEERHNYFLSCVAELRKVHWPTWDNTKKLTWIVVVVVAIFSVILTAFDWVWSLVWGGLLKILVV